LFFGFLAIWKIGFHSENGISEKWLFGKLKFGKLNFGKLGFGKIVIRKIRIRKIDFGILGSYLLESEVDFMSKSSIWSVKVYIPKRFQTVNFCLFSFFCWPRWINPSEVGGMEGKRVFLMGNNNFPSYFRV